MDLEIVILSEVSQTEKDKYCISLICGILKMDASELIYKIDFMVCIVTRSKERDFIMIKVNPPSSVQFSRSVVSNSATP